MKLKNPQHMLLRVKINYLIRNQHMLKLLFLKKKKLKKLKNAKLLVLLTFINLLMHDYYITFFAYLSIEF